jgi:DNA-binding transcriptional ArsR family regulator
VKLPLATPVPTCEPRNLSSTECAHVLRGIAEPVRIDILALLRAGPLPVHAVMKRLALRQYQASRHLNALTALGLLRRERRGREVYFGLADGAVRSPESSAIELGCCRVDIKAGQAGTT